jgi:hypothetical protein
MTGVPGGQFANSTEVGVDCDNGTNCRNGGVLGLCKAWGRTCQSDDDCRHGYCQKDGSSLCTTINDCAQDPGVCSVPAWTCTQTATTTQTTTDTQTLTSTQTVTNTPTVTNTRTDTGTATDTRTPTSTRTFTGSPTLTNTRTSTYTPGTITGTPTNTFTSSQTSTPTNTPNGTVSTPTMSWTWTSTITATITPTLTGTLTATNTSTDTPTSSFTFTRTWTSTVTPTDTATSTDTMLTTGTPTFTPTTSATILPGGTDTPTDTETSTDTPTTTPTDTPSVTPFIPTPTFTPLAQVSQLIDYTQPAVVSVGDGMTVSIPANSLTQNVTMTISKYDSTTFVNGNDAFQGQYMPFVYWIDTGGIEPQSSASITITIPYDPASVPNGVLETDLMVTFFDGTSWVTLPTTVDTVNHTLTVVTNHFSLWAVTFGMKTSTPTPSLSASKPVLYPNPAKGSQTNLLLPRGQNVKVAIYTVSYRQVREINVGDVPSVKILTLDLQDKVGSTLANGVYYVTVTSLNTRWTGKLLIFR